MPLTLIVTEGVIPKEREQATMVRLFEAFLARHGLTGNRFLTPNLIGWVQVIPHGSTYAGVRPTPVAIIEWKAPAFAFSTRDVQTGYVEEATTIIHEMSGGKHPKEQTWVSVTYAVDGTWGIGGRAYTNAELGAMVSKG